MRVLLGLILLVGVSASATVWDDQREWSAQDDRAFGQWVSTSVKRTFYKDLGGHFRRLRLDCADALYGLRAYYAAKNGLSFAAKGGNITNRMSRFDRFQNPDQRLAKFIAYMANTMGTETMAHQDTYSIAIDDLRPGDLFMYKYSTNGKAFTRHSWIIKNINIDGTFDVLYSTQARRDNGRPMARTRYESFQHKPLHSGSNKYAWGFRRWRRPEHMGLRQSQIPGANFEQFQLARKLSEYQFFRRVNRVNRTVQESPQKVMARHFNAVCKELKSRKQVVEDAVSYQKTINYRCMNAAEYDKYSTPSRDGGIKKKYDWFRLAKNELQNKDAFGRVHEETRRRVRTIFDLPRKSSDTEFLYRSCPTAIGSYKIDMGFFWDALRNGWASSHPNDNRYRRWGINRGTPTSCEAYY